jgi:hypothetical protein
VTNEQDARFHYKAYDENQEIGKNAESEGTIQEKG